MHRCLDFLLRESFHKTLSNSDSCQGLLYSLILCFLVEGHLPLATPAVSPPSKWDREMRISLVVNLFTAAVQFQRDIKLLITAEQTAPHRYSLSTLQPSSSSAGVGGSRRKCEWTHSISRGLTWLFKKPTFLRERVPGIYTHLHFVLLSAQFSKCRSDFLR